MESIRRRRDVLFERMKWELKNASVVEKRQPPAGEIQERLHKLSDLCEQFDKAQSEIEKQPVFVEINSILTHRFEFEKMYYKVKGCYIMLLDKRNPHGSSEGTIVEPADDLKEAIRLLLDSQRILMTSQAAASNTVSQLAGKVGSVSLSHPVADAQASGGHVPLEVRLPTIALPVFKGDWKQWPSFKDLFESCIHSKNLKNSVKLQYLLSHLDGEAKKMVSSYAITDAYYVGVWDRLNEFYGKKKCTVAALVKEFVDQPPVTAPTLVGLRKLTSTSDDVVRQLKALGEEYETRDPWLIHLLLEKLDRETQSLWAQMLVDEDNPCFQDFLTFLERRCEALETCASFSKKGTDATTKKEQERKVDPNTKDRKISPGEPTTKWLPSHLEQSDSLDTAQRDTQILFRKFRSVLNKLTSDNLFGLVDQVKSFVIDTDERLDGCVEMLFQKAISEPMFAEVYARMCKEIGTIEVVNDASKKRSLSFKNRLLAQCQAKFEHRRDSNKEPIEELKTQCEQTLQEERRRYVGTVRIIGELYKMKQLTSSVMKSCIMQLLETGSKDCSEEDLKCLCVLLTTIGRKMEVDNGKNLGPYFEKVHDILHNKEKYRLSRKIRFAIQDVMELRQNGWTTKQQGQDQRAAEPTQDYRGTVQRGSGRWINFGGCVYERDNRAQSWRLGNRNPSVNLEQLLMNNIERDEVSRKTVAHYVAQMFKEKAIAKVDYLQALKKVFEQADDLIIDIPELYKFISIFYVRLLNMAYIDLRDIRYVARSMLPKYGLVILRELLLQYRALYGLGDTAKLWFESALKWTDFITMDNPKQIEQYLMDPELGYLVDIVKFEQQFQSSLISAEEGMSDLHLN